MATHPDRFTLSAESLAGNSVKNSAGEDLGTVKDFMIDLGTGRVAYAVLSFGGFMGFGDKLFAVPFLAMQLDSNDHSFVLDLPKDLLKESDGFDQNNWPDTTDLEWARGVHDRFNVRPYWE